MDSIPGLEKPERLCACGCGESFAPRRKHQRFISADHRVRFHRRSAPVLRLTEQRIRRMMEAALAAAFESDG